MSAFSLRGDGRVALVTGGGAGLGRAVAEVFGEAGYRLLLVDVDREAGAAAAAGLTAAGWPARFVAADVADGPAVCAAIEAARDEWGRLDFVLNNAGISGRLAAIENLDEDDLERVLAVNLKGPFLVCKHAVPALRASGGGVIVNVASITGETGAACFSPYAASKAGLVALTRSLARRVGRYNVRVNCLAPGSIDGTGLMRSCHAEQGTTPEQLKGQTLGMLRRIPLGRLAQPRDVAHVALFLASPWAAHVHGAVVTVDGGERLGFQ
ncbi:MAG TPA: SDR family NAD(P)-dependent oxidoreductase [Thermoanaerobaculia bacterium]|nr:SDR family NAD(P)-dependent oxidoreductase [Thermoanaerobaculia bacterium]